MDELRKRQRTEEYSSFYYDNPDYRPPHFGDSQTDSRSDSSGAAPSCSTSDKNEESDIESAPLPNMNVEPYASNPNWRKGVFLKIFTGDNRGFGWHKKKLREMEMHGTEKDKSLLGVLKDIIAPAAEQSEDDLVLTPYR